MVKIIDYILGLFGTIPNGWKQRFYSLLLSLVAVIELFADVPDSWHTEKVLTQVALVLAVVASFITKLLRDRGTRQIISRMGRR